MADQIQELKFQVGEAWKGVYDNATAYSLAAVVQDPTGLSVYRSLKSGNVGHPVTDSAWWFRIIDMSSIKAENDRIKALNDAIAADEALRVAAEELRQQKEAERIAAETQRDEAEQARISAEQNRATKESQREANEQQRISAEQSRVTAESARVQAEQARALAEALRANAEDQRAANEQNRVAAEQQRIANEQARIEQEQQRETKEAERQQTFVQSQAARQEAYEQAEAARQETFEQNEVQRDAEASALQTKLENGEVVPALADDIKSWEDTNTLVPYIQKTAQETTGGDISIRSDVQARLDGIAPTSRRWKATKLVACGTNLLRPTSQAGGIATAIGTGIYFPCPALTFGTYGTAQENNGIVFTDSDHAFLTPTVYMKRIADGVPTSVTDGVQAQTVSGQNGETFYVNPASLAGEAVYVIVSGITLASSCAHIAWSGNGTPYNYYIAPDAEAPANVEITLASLLTAIGNDGYLTQVGGVGDMLLYEDKTHMRCTRRNGRVQPAWTTEAEEVEGTPTGNYIHTATIGAMLSDGAAELEADGTRLQVSGTEVSYTDQSDTATTDYVLYNLATETSSVVDVSPMLTVNDFGLIVLLGNDGTADTTIGYAQGIADSVRALMTGGYDEVNRVIAEALNALHADNVRLAALVMELEKKTTPLTSDTAGAPSAANTPEGWNADRYGAWRGWPACVGQEYIDTASQKLYKALAHTGSVSDWVVMN